MDEYIKREDALEITKRTSGDYATAFAEICKIPAADISPVVHGRWIEQTVPEGRRYFECSNCGAHENRHTAIKGYYCWRCGAKMDGGEDNG